MYDTNELEEQDDQLSPLRPPPPKISKRDKKSRLFKLPFKSKKSRNNKQSLDFLGDYTPPEIVVKHSEATSFHIDNQDTDVKTPLTSSKQPKALNEISKSPSSLSISSSSSSSISLIDRSPNSTVDTNNILGSSEIAKTRFTSPSNKSLVDNDDLREELSKIVDTNNHKASSINEQTPQFYSRSVSTSTGKPNNSENRKSCLNESKTTNNSSSDKLSSKRSSVCSLSQNNSSSNKAPLNFQILDDLVDELYKQSKSNTKSSSNVYSESNMNATESISDLYMRALIDKRNEAKMNKKRSPIANSSSESSVNSHSVKAKPVSTADMRTRSQILNNNATANISLNPSGGGNNLNNVKNRNSNTVSTVNASDMNAETDSIITNESEKSCF
jgi:hypothetical protein